MRKMPSWVLVAAATVAVVGSGVATAAVTSGSDGVEVAEEPTTTVPTDPVTTTLPADDDPATDEPTDDEAGETARYWGLECGEDPTNHGGYVARAEKNGVSRSEAAHSPCGKPLASVHVTTTTTLLEEPPVEEATSDDAKGPKTHGNGGGTGNGGGQGHGHGH